MSEDGYVVLSTHVTASLCMPPLYDGSVGVFDATARLQLRCRITPSAYKPK